MIGSSRQQSLGTIVVVVRLAPNLFERHALDRRFELVGLIAPYGPVRALLAREKL
jgi:hypothetical protein